MNNKKSQVGKTLASLIIVSALIFIVMSIVMTPTQVAEININTQLLRSQLQKCQYEYKEAIRLGEDKTKIDLDGDECLDTFDICIVAGRKGVTDSDRDGVPDDCDGLSDNPSNIEGTTKYRLETLCYKASENNLWDSESGRCCHKDFVEKNPYRLCAKAEAR